MNAFDDLITADGASLEFDDDLDDINRLYIERGWTDGLPIVPPTAARVKKMLAYCDRPLDEAIVRLGPRNGECTPLRLATNAVMAGARPEFFPLIVLALEAMCEKRFRLSGIQTTTHNCVPLIIFNGPVVKELKINSGNNAFSGGNVANATIGRAVHLALLNIGGAIPMLGDMATFGSPAKLSYCVAENEDESPWEPLHVERGFPAHASTVTVVGAECPHNINDHESTTALGVLTTIAGSMGIAGSNDVYHDVAEPVLVFSPEHAKTVAAEGYSKADAKRYICEHANLPLAKFSPENVERRLRTYFKGRYDNVPPETLVPTIQHPEDLIVVVIGGPGKHSAYIPSFGATLSVTRALKTRDGEYAKSISEFQQA